MIVSMIAAVAENNAIGKDNDLIWNLPVDMKFFKDTTKGHHVIMGRKNFESIPHKYRPLPGRPNVVVTRQSDYAAPGAQVVNSIQEGLDIARAAGDDEAFIIGGGQIYGQALEDGLVDKMYITHVHERFEADAFFPEFDPKNWDKNQMMVHPIDDRHPHAFTIIEYLRK